MVEPDYYSQYPPLGLLKLSSYHKKEGDEVTLAEGVEVGLNCDPDRVYVTSLWTWEWEEVWRCVRYYQNLYPDAEVWLGGLYASILPGHAKESGADKVYEGLFEPAENLVPDYSLVPDWDASILFTTRGCNSNCGFCIVPKIEGELRVIKNSVEKFVQPDHSKVVLWDNDFLASPARDELLDELSALEKKVDFNQGLRASYIDKEIAKKLSDIRLGGVNGSTKVRIAYDTLEESKIVRRAIENLHSAGFSNRDIMVYTLFNWKEGPNKFFRRVRNILDWGAVSYPMRYQPLDSREKNDFVHHNWTEEELEMVEAARRVIGYGGSFPPYEGLVKKFNEAQGFHEGLELREKR